MFKERKSIKELKRKLELQSKELQAFKEALVQAGDCLSKLAGVLDVNKKEMGLYKQTIVNMLGRLEKLERTDNDDIMYK